MFVLFIILITAYVIISILCKSDRSGSFSNNDTTIENGSGLHQNVINPIECPFCKSSITAPPPYTSHSDLTSLSNVNQPNYQSCIS